MYIYIYIYIQPGPKDESLTCLLEKNTITPCHMVCDLVRRLVYIVCHAVTTHTPHLLPASAFSCSERVIVDGHANYLSCGSYVFSFVSQCSVLNISVMGRRKYLTSEEETAQICALYKQKIATKDIANCVGVCERSVQRVVKKFKEGGESAMPERAWGSLLSMPSPWPWDSSPPTFLAFFHLSL